MLALEHCRAHHRDSDGSSPNNEQASLSIYNSDFFLAIFLVRIETVHDLEE